MKTQKKVLALALTLVLAFVMTLSLAVTAFADPNEEATTPTTYKITIENTNKDHVYEAYQIFKGDYSDGVLSNIEWGAGVTLQGTDTLTVGNDTLTATEWANKLSGELYDSDLAKAFADAVSKVLATTATGTSTALTSDDGAVTGYEINGLAAGYYLVKDQKESLDGANDTYTRFILKVVGNSTVAPKGDKPKVEKKVKDKNDSTGNASGWQDSADHDIGDTVEFQLKGTLPTNFDEYTRYKYVFHDTLSDGLTYNKDAKVYVEHEDGSRDEVTTYFDIDEEDGQLTVKCVNLKMSKFTPKLVSSDKIIVEYTATLNGDAVVGVPGNPNEVYLEYSNDPNYKGEGKKDDEEDDDEPTGDTPKDKVVVFTYQLDGTKVDENDDPLAGAGFTLYKWVDYLPDNAEAEEPTYKNKTLPALPEDWDKTVYTGTDLTPKSDHGTWIVVKELDVTGSDGKFGFKGLDDGEYVLVETTVPDKYNKADDIYFTISADHEVLDDDPELTELNITFKQGSTEGTWAANLHAEGEYTGKYDGTFGGNIENNKGTSLPSTGGIGTTIFYIVGGLLVVFTGVLLITKSRMRGKN